MGDSGEYGLVQVPGRECVVGPLGPCVPPKPKAEPGACKVSVRRVPGESIAYCMATLPPIDQPNRWNEVKLRACAMDERSSEKSRTPRVALIGSAWVSPKPRISGA